MVRLAACDQERRQCSSRCWAGLNDCERSKANIINFNGEIGEDIELQQQWDINPANFGELITA